MEKFRGTLDEVFLISGRGVVLAISDVTGEVSIGDKLSIEMLKVVVRGIEMIQSRRPLQAENRSIGVLVDLEFHAQLTELRGRQVTASM